MSTAIQTSIIDMMETIRSALSPTNIKAGLVKNAILSVDIGKSVVSERQVSKAQVRVSFRDQPGEDGSLQSRYSVAWEQLGLFKLSDG